MKPIIVNGVEYVEYPPPEKVWRATQYDYATSLIEHGILCLTNAEVYRNDPDPERGDETETDGVFIRQGVRCTTGHTNPIFLWSTTLEANPQVLLDTWRDCDIVVCINNPKVLAEKILKTAISQNVRGVSFYAGEPLYDKGQGGIGAYRWAESIFQKPEKQAAQQEYRFALVGDYSMIDVKRIKLTLGPCSDLISIVKRRQCEP